jgi:hypothetical protein
MMLNGSVTVALPGGYWLDGVCYREAGLRPLTGEDEAFLLETDPVLLPAQRITAILARCLTHLGPLRPVPPQAVQQLTIGDREALLLHLRRLTLGERLPCVLKCPHSDCGEKMDLELRVGDLLLAAYPHTQAFHEATVMGQGSPYRVRFRLPTGGDQEAASSLACADPQAGVELLLRRCVEHVLADDDRPSTTIPPAVASELPTLMARLDPQAELILNLVCPVCSHAFSTLFDTAAYFFQEVSSRMMDLYREVHFLAWHYHWSEAGILAMTGRKRRLYLGFLAEALSKRRDR